MNRKTMILMTSICLIMLIVIFFPPQVVWLHSSDHPAKTHPAKTTHLVKPKSLTKNGFTYIPISNLEKRWKFVMDMNYIDGKVTFVHNKKKVILLQEIPVMQINGHFVPIEAGMLKEKNEFWITNESIRQIEKELKDDKNSIHSPAIANQRIPLNKVVSYLSFLEKPIHGAHVSTKDTQLPGAPRTYRNGVHEGIDWYSYTTGVEITKNTPVLSMADGVIVRADHEYHEMSEEERDQLLKQAATLDRTPEYILDKLRGRSVWIQYDKGVLARYVHLDRISDKVKVGDKVKKGQLIGYVGNSGTSDGVLGNKEGLHLHLDIFIYGEWFWKYYTLDERRSILEKVFPKKLIPYKVDKAVTPRSKE
ncbi:M23 family metallopeptidase [Thermoflavimicrobium daqui]|uniref:M23ase beta-sheet core domain-containing protein n=1 Tax=Thermoflavimicrobium daqui TaxID=2137476 RepID=A0A364K6Q6_9BACL|nr:M23 family metallopeptidase [Thermoflavimicrobium daqui]RAL25973.1 hypothetical protein DL897_07870 [Thermoflavimicrobium daqui]